MRKLLVTVFALGSMLAAGADKTDELMKKLEALESGESAEVKTPAAKGKTQEKKAQKTERKSKRDEIAEREVSGVYYLPPEIKVTKDERSRVIGDLRRRMGAREEAALAAKGKAPKAKTPEELEAAEAEKKQKEEAELQKHKAKLEKQQKIKAIEKTLGISPEEANAAEYEGMSPEMANILRKNKELDKTYQKKVGN